MKKAPKVRTSIEALLEQATATGYVVLDGMAAALLEVAYVEATMPDIDPATLPKAADYAFWKRCKMVDGMHARVGH